MFKWKTRKGQPEISRKLVEEKLVEGKLVEEKLIEGKLVEGKSVEGTHPQLLSCCHDITK